MGPSGETPRTTLITGGTRSGKSSYALQLAQSSERPFFIATGWATDAEMARRIRKHQAERDARWQLLEVRTEVSRAIHQAEEAHADFILVDCLTLWTSNVFLEDENALPEKTEELVRSIRACTVPLALVTNEVGSGIVPENKLARRYRDAAGFVNRSVADAVDALILMVCGQPLRIK